MTSQGSLHCSAFAATAILARSATPAPRPCNAPIRKTEIRSFSVALDDAQTCYTDPAFVFFHDDPSAFNQSRAIACHSKSSGFLETAIGEHSVFLDRRDDLLHISVLSHSDEETPELVSCDYEDCSVRSVIP